MMESVKERGKKEKAGVEVPGGKGPGGREFEEDGKIIENFRERSTVWAAF